MQKAFLDIVERLEELKNQYIDDCFVQKTMAICDAIIAVNQVAEEYKSNDGWIPCERELPKLYEPVLVCNKEGRVFIRCINWISNGRVKIPSWSQYSSGIIAWQPLPQPYVKGE